MERLIRDKFIAAGFLVGYVAAEDAKFGPWYTNWLERGYQAGMSYMERNLDLREDPASIEPWGKSFIVLAYPYKTPAPAGWEVKNPISRYAWGKDYHKELKKLIKPILRELEAEIGPFQHRMFTDSAPLPEKLLAQRAGLGFIGKNSLLINRSHGSYIFLAEVLTDLDLTSSTVEEQEGCGTCTQCRDHCPGDAIQPKSMINANRCISYLTIEKKGEFQQYEKLILDYQLFGCDICQECCPYNQDKPLQGDSPFSPLERWQGLTPDQVLGWSPEDFEKFKINSPIKRTGLEGMRRNGEALLNKN